MPNTMDAMGHASPALTLSVYAKAMKLDDEDRSKLRALAEGAELVPIGREKRSEPSEEPTPEAA
jgi:hypothetical protein